MYAHHQLYFSFTYIPQKKKKYDEVKTRKITSLKRKKTQLYIAPYDLSLCLRPIILNYQFYPLLLLNRILAVFSQLSLT